MAVLDELQNLNMVMSAKKELGFHLAVFGYYAKMI
jgi:hypothetical protein